MFVMSAGLLYGLAIVLCVLTGLLPAYAQPAPSAGAPPAQVRQLLDLMQDPVVRAWADEQQESKIVTAASDAPTTTSGMMTRRITNLQEHLASLAAAVPRLHDEFRQARLRLLGELRGRSGSAVLILAAAFLALGGGSEWIFRRASSQVRVGLSHPEATVSRRLRTLAARLGIDASGVLIFAFGSIGAFLAFDWPQILQQIVVAYLAAAVVLRLALVGGRFVLAPTLKASDEIERLRLIPMGTEAARFWMWRLGLFVGWFTFGWASVDVLRVIGFSPEARMVVAYALGLGLLALALNVAWTRPRPVSEASPGEVASWQVSHMVGAGLLSICLVLLWGLWVAGLTGLFWLGTVALLLPAAIRVAELVAHRAVGTPDGSAAPGERSLTAVYLDRGVRALLIVGAVLLLAHVWRIDLVEMTSRDTLPTRLLRGVLSSVVILLVADLVWQVTKTLIDRRLAQTEVGAAQGGEAASRQARLRTLLPIFRNVLFAVVAVVAVLMVLSALGVQIGPLIAGAGVVGVAVGFGSQTLVKDIISGVFYLLDDAFRVGEYIQSGSYKGTVESFSLRSVKLRHHRGPVYTVPFGQLGAVQNMSRDWVIDKFEISVTYDTDLEKARKLIKRIGQEMAEDPAFAPNIIEPLKMQGVEQFGEYAIKIRCKMTARPGEQFVIRRKAFARIKQAFDENGIRFAFPTVQVASGGETAAAAFEGLHLVKPPGAAE